MRTEWRDELAEIRIALTDEQLEVIAERVAELLAERSPAAADGYLDSDEAAEYLGCSRGRVHDLVQVGKLEPRRDGRRLRFRRSDLEHYLEASR